MDEIILKVDTEKLKIPIGTTGVIKKLSRNSAGIFKSHFEQFITTQPGITDLVDHICQSLTYNDSKSAKCVNKEFQVWISNSKLFRLAYEADTVIDKVISSINDRRFREHFGRFIKDVYKSIIDDCKADMLKIFVEIMKDYFAIDMAFPVIIEKNEILFSYAKHMMNLCFSFEIVALFVGFRFTKLGVKNVIIIIKDIIGM